VEVFPVDSAGDNGAGGGENRGVWWEEHVNFDILCESTVATRRMVSKGLPGRVAQDTKTSVGRDGSRGPAS
jgi:hypothetical protein